MVRPVRHRHRLLGEEVEEDAQQWVQLPLPEQGQTWGLWGPTSAGF